MTPAGLEQVHKEILGFQRIEAVSDEMRALVEELWPECYTSCCPSRRASHF
jgi:hypothetical protein